MYALRSYGVLLLCKVRFNGMDPQPGTLAEGAVNLAIGPVRVSTLGAAAWMDFYVYIDW